MYVRVHEYEVLVTADLLFHRCGKEERETHIAACIGEADGDIGW